MQSQLTLVYIIIYYSFTALFSILFSRVLPYLTISSFENLRQTFCMSCSYSLPAICLLILPHLIWSV
jgi:hypothetical protein